MASVKRRIGTLGLAGAAAFLAPAPGAQEVLTPVSTATFAWAGGNKAVYLDYPANKTAVIEIDLDSKAKRTLVPEGGATPYYVDVSFDGEHLAYVPFSTKPQYPLEYLNTRTGAKKTLDSDPGWKESPWVGGGKVVWIDYRHKTASDKNGEVYLHDLASGSTRRITDNAGYQAKPVTDGRSIAWLDYSDGNKAALTLHDIASGATTTPSPTGAHQDNPRIDGDWLVWEDYRNAAADTANADIYAYNLRTREVKILCDRPGYQGTPFLQGLAVVWADYRDDAGDGARTDIYGYDLAAGAEHRVTSRPGFDSSPAVDGNRVVWFGIEGTAMNLYAGPLPFTPSSLAPRPGPKTGASPSPAARFRPDGRRLAPSKNAAASPANLPGALGWR